MARASLVKLERLSHFNDSVFGEFITDAPQNKINNALNLVEEAFGSAENVIRVLEADGYEIRFI
jgi:hypothetical protein